jgi:hypothetical protein
MLIISKDCGAASSHAFYWISGMPYGKSMGLGDLDANSIQAVDGTNVQVGTATGVNENNASFAMFVI